MSSGSREEFYVRRNDRDGIVTSSYRDHMMMMHFVPTEYTKSVLSLIIVFINSHWLFRAAVLRGY